MYNGGVVGKANIPTQSVATGVWNMRELFLARRQNIWPIENASADPYFEYVTMLLNTGTTNGAQNNTFLDASTNNFTITRNGDTTQGSFNPYMPTGYWSGYFDGNGDLLTLPSSSAFDFSATPNTIEFWAYPLALPGSGNSCRIILAGANNTTNAFTIYFDSAGILYAAVPRLGYTALSTSTGIVEINKWQHFAIIQNGASSAIYKDGVQVASGTITSPTSANNDLKIGYDTVATVNFNYFGYISNLRVVKGTAVYTSAFTPPTTPLTAITNTSLLCLQDNRFKDNSTNAFTITRNGDTRISKFAPFNPPASWDAATYGGSGYFDGTGDYLTVPSTSALAMGAGDFCLDAWIYPTALSADQVIYGNFATGGVNTQMGFFVRNANSIRFASWDTAFLDSAAGTIVGNTWQHIVVCRSGTTMSLFINGSRQATTTSSNNFSSTDAFQIGRRSDNTQLFVGYISNLRAIKGSTPYDPTQTTLTVPTTPLTAITNTSLLLNFTNAGIYDASTINDAQTVGNAQVSTTQAKFGTTSMYFDGTGDWLKLPDNPAYAFRTGDFTVEAWVYANAFAAAEDNIVGCWNQEDGVYRWLFCLHAGTSIRFYTTGKFTTTASYTFSTNTWYHVAVTRSSGTVRFFVDGTQVGSNITDTVDIGSTKLFVGGQGASGTGDMNGYIDELRITNGYARYTANFTPPSSPFQTL